MAVETILRNKSGHAVLGYDETTATLSRLAQGGLVAATPAVEPVCWNKSGDPVLGYLEPTDALVVLAGGGVVTAPATLAPRTYEGVVRADGPSNYWRLDETSGLLARDRVGGKDGTISGGVTLNQAGALADGNPAMRFNGTSGVIDLSVAGLSPAFTVEQWIKTTGVSGNAVLFALAELLWYLTPGSLRVQLNGHTPANVAVSAKPLASGTWHHVAITQDGTSLRGYVDGVLDTTTPQPRVATAPAVGAIGAQPTGFADWWPGSLDEVAVYPVALTPAQIAAHYAAGYGLFPTVEPILRSHSGHAVLGYNEATDQVSVLCQGSL